MNSNWFNDPTGAAPRRAYAYLLPLVLLCAGCGPKPKVRSPVYPVTGKVLVDGAPAKDARLFFFPQQAIDGEAIRPLAVTNEKGEFQPTTYLAGDGLPAGEYHVTVTWPELKEDAGEIQEGPDRLRGAYGDQLKPAANVSIKEGVNEIPVLRLWISHP